MTEALVPLSATPAMSLCSICPDPGLCCRRFNLSNRNGDDITFWRTSWEKDAAEWLRDHQFPFEAIGIREEYQSNVPGTAGQIYVSLWYRCPAVTADGRCSIYETRPELCRSYVPESSPLCAMHPSHLAATK